MAGMITPEQNNIIVNLIENAASKAAKEAMASLPLEKEAVQEAIIKNKDEFQTALVPVITTALRQFLSERVESFEAVKTSALIKIGAPSPYFDKQFYYWRSFWKELGIKNPDFAGIRAFVEHPGFRPLILPKNELITAQYLYDCCLERFRCCKHYKDSLDNVKNDRDSMGAYVVWFRDKFEADQELKNLSANELKEKKNFINLPERIIMEYDYFGRTGGHLDISTATLCAGSCFTNGSLPLVFCRDSRMYIRRCSVRRAVARQLRYRQCFFTF